MTVEEYFSLLPKINTSCDFDKYLENGNKLPLPNEALKDEFYRLYNSKGVFMAIYKRDGNGLKPFKMFL